LAVLVLLVVLTLLSWLRRQTVGELEANVRDMAQSFQPGELLHGAGGNSMARFAQAEALVRRGLLSGHIEEAVVSIWTPEGEEIFIVPYTFAADHSDEAERTRVLAAYTKEPLGDPRQPFGHLYLKLDWTAIQRINWAIVSTALAIVLMLVALLARVLSQETSLRRTVIELTERRSELIRLERLALAGHISAGLLHDLRKPVMHIRHSLEDLEEALGDFAPAAQSLKDLQQNTRLFFNILGESQMERFVRSDQVGDEFVDIGVVLDDSFKLVRFERGAVEVERYEGEDLPTTVYAHPFKLIQLFSNLILNAYQAMGGRGQLRVDVTSVDGGVLVRLTDNGPGIPTEDQERVFDPFFSTKQVGEGTGLGLSICRLIVEELGGRIRVESRLGGPTAFVVWLPSVDKVAARQRVQMTNPDAQENWEPEETLQIRPQQPEAEG
jgi:signal transduction histidine kinase